MLFPALFVAGLALGVHAFISVYGIRESLQATNYAVRGASGSALSAFPMLPASFIAAAGGSGEATASGALPFFVYIEVALAYFLVLIGGYRTFFKLQNVSRKEELMQRKYEGTVSSGSDFASFNHRGRVRPAATAE